MVSLAFSVVGLEVATKAAPRQRAAAGAAAPNNNPTHRLLDLLDAELREAVQRGACSAAGACVPFNGVPEAATSPATSDLARRPPPCLAPIWLDAPSARLLDSEDASNTM